MILMEDWLPALSQFTPSSVLLPLGERQVACLLELGQKLTALYWKDLRRIQKAQLDQVPLGLDSWLGLECVSDAPALEQLISDLNKALGGRPAFVKMSLRSAKDSLALKKYRHLALRQNPDLPPEEADRLSARVLNGQQAVQLLATSQRVKTDLLKLGVRSTVVIREWLFIPFCLQFRGFVHQGRLTALSSYFTQKNASFLLPFKPIIQGHIEALFLLIKGRLPADCVLDLGIELPNSQSADEKEIGSLLSGGSCRAWLIEINAWGKESGSALFSWDQPVIQTGPLQFRLAGQIANTFD